MESEIDLPLRMVSANSASPASVLRYFSAAPFLPLAAVAAATTLSAETIPLRASTAIISGLRDDEVGAAAVAFTTPVAEAMTGPPFERGGRIWYTIQCFGEFFFSELRSRYQGYLLLRLGLSNHRRTLHICESH